MFLFKTVATLQQHLQLLKAQDETIAFVPTMGALHDGHMTLMNKGKERADVVVCSIFVNPTQFDQADDLDKYPRTVGRDMALLFEHEVDILFLPPVEEIYPYGTIATDNIDLSGLDQTMEGPNRPGHFDGVVQVVKRLLEIVQPDELIMGKKDFQQLSIIGHMLRVLGWQEQIKLVGVDTVRETNGLARSSRNERLSITTREKAALIYQTLQWAKSQMKSLSIHDIKTQARRDLSVPPFRPEYFEIVDAQTLQPLELFNPAIKAVACAAVWADDVRLIDNIELN